MKNRLKKVGIGFGVLLVISVVLVVTLFFNELKTLSSLNKVDDYPFYTMTYSGMEFFQKKMQWVCCPLLKYPIKFSGR